MKNKYPREHKTISRATKQKIITTKSKCLSQKTDYFNLFKKVKQYINIQTFGQLVDSDGMVIIDKRQNVET